MAHSMFALIDQAVRQFYEQWSYGCQPSVVIETQSNGDIKIINKVAAPLAVTQSQQHHPKRRHRSGRASRLRRRESRDQVHSEGSLSAEQLPDTQPNEEIIELHDQSTNPESVQAIEIRKPGEIDEYQAEIRKCIDMLEKEIVKKDELIFKLQLNISDLKFQMESNSIKSVMNLTVQRACSVDIPPTQPQMYQTQPARSGLPPLSRNGGAPQ